MKPTKPTMFRPLASHRQPSASETKKDASSVEPQVDSVKDKPTPPSLSIQSKSTLELLDFAAGKQGRKKKTKGVVLKLE